MAINLPALPRQTRISFSPVEFGGPLPSSLGGPTQHIRRLGDRFAVVVEMPRMEKACAAKLVAARLRSKAEGDTLRLPVPQNGDGAAAGTPTCTAGAVNTATLTKSGGGPVAVGMMFSFVVGGVSYLHMVTSVNGNTLGVAPLLRASPVGQTLNFQAPLIEGMVDGPAWDIERMRFVGQTFTLTEAR